MTKINDFIEKDKDNSLEFVKYQACGNTFIVTEAEKEKVSQFKNSPLIIKDLLNEKFGIGADGVIFLERSDKADRKMRLFDKIEDKQVFEAFMSGNGIRCAADYLNTLLKKDHLEIETRDGVKEIRKLDNKYRVNMGEARYKVGNLEEFLDLDNFSIDLSKNEDLLEKKIRFSEIGEIKTSIVNSGDPHAVIFLEDIHEEKIENVDLNKYGKIISKNSSKFPIAMNTNICEIIDKAKIKVRTFEAGVLRETLSCGTGATAAAVASYLTNKVENKRVEVDYPGGELIVNINENNVFLTGPAVSVFSGRVDIENLPH